MTRICPNPMPWHDIFEGLTRHARTHLCIPPSPPKPLILAGWAYSNDVEKEQRWKETVDWAINNGCPEIVAVPDEAFYDVDVPTSYVVGPLGGPMYSPSEFEEKDRPPSNQICDDQSLDTACGVRDTMNRSYELITKSDLHILVELARNDREDLFRRKPAIGRLYSDRLFAVALCQGGALHYLNGKNGIKDLDVWSFFIAHSDRPFPYRRRSEVDLGIPKFGKTEGYDNFIGRKVDLIGRSIQSVEADDPVDILRQYLRNGHTESARRLAEKAVILLEPAHLFETVVWPEENPC